MEHCSEMECVYNTQQFAQKHFILIQELSMENALIVLKDAKPAIEDFVILVQMVSTWIMDNALHNALTKKHYSQMKVFVYGKIPCARHMILRI